MPTVLVTFVQATYTLVTFVHISNISVVTGLILTWTKLLRVQFFFNTKFFSRPKISFGLKVFRLEILLDPKKNLDLKLFFKPKIFLDPKFFKSFFFIKKFFWTHFFFQKNFRTQNFFPKFFTN